VGNDALSIDTNHWPAIDPGYRLQGWETPKWATVRKKNGPPFPGLRLDERTLMNTEIYVFGVVTDNDLLLVRSVNIL
jgi:hypothetical protein